MNRRPPPPAKLARQPGKPTVADTGMRPTDRPATTEPESLPLAEDAAQDVWRLRRVIADEISAARINGVGPWVAADAIAKALDRAGYTVAPKPSPLQPPRPMTDEEAAEFERRFTEAVSVGRYATGVNTAVRAPEAPGDANTPTPDVGAAQGREDGSATESEPRTMRPEDVPEAWIALAREAHRTAPQKRDGKPTRMRHALAAVIPAIRAQVADEIEAATPEVTVMTSTQVIYQANGMRHAARIARGDQ